MQSLSWVRVYLCTISFTCCPESSEFLCVWYLYRATCCPLLVFKSVGLHDWLMVDGVACRCVLAQQQQQKWGAAPSGKFNSAITDAPSVTSRSPAGKSWRRIYVHTLGRNPSPVITVPTAVHRRVTYSCTLGHTQVRNPLLVLTALIAPRTRATWTHMSAANTSPASVVVVVVGI